ncbi:TPA: hypothetical protein ACP32N_005117 [Pseudomonas aeruginosa]
MNIAQLLNHQVIHHLMSSNHPDLHHGRVTANLVEVAGEVLQDQFLDNGFCLHSSFMDGQVLVQTYHEPRSGAFMPDIGFSLGLFLDRGSCPLKILLHAGSTPVSLCEAASLFEPAVRISRDWFLPLRDSLRAADLLGYLRKTTIQVLGAAA